MSDKPIAPQQTSLPSTPAPAAPVAPAETNLAWFSKNVLGKMLPTLILMSVGFVFVNMAKSIAAEQENAPKMVIKMGESNHILWSEYRIYRSYSFTL